MPFHNPNTLDFLSDLRREFKPNKVICMGDCLDAHGFSSFNKDPDIAGIKDELEQGKKELKKVFKLFPKIDFLLSNHTGRYIKKATNAGIPRQLIKNLKEILDAPKDAHWHDYLIYENIYFFHGDGFAGQRAPIDMIKQFHMNVCHGHLHSVAGTTYLNLGRETFFCLSTGCLIDPKALAFAYGKEHKEKPILGTGVIVDGSPYFIRMSE